LLLLGDMPQVAHQLAGDDFESTENHGVILAVPMFWDLEVLHSVVRIFQEPACGSENELENSSANNIKSLDATVNSKFCAWVSI
jgi:hypothetical protein